MSLRDLTAAGREVYLASAVWMAPRALGKRHETRMKPRKLFPGRRRARAAHARFRRLARTRD
jgi:hypothetical protein